MEIDGNDENMEILLPPRKLGQRASLYHAHYLRINQNGRRVTLNFWLFLLKLFLTSNVQCTRGRFRKRPI